MSSSKQLTLPVTPEKQRSDSRLSMRSTLTNELIATPEFSPKLSPLKRTFSQTSLDDAPQFASAFIHWRLQCLYEQIKFLTTAEEAVIEAKKEEQFMFTHITRTRRTRERKGRSHIPKTVLTSGPRRRYACYLRRLHSRAGICLCQRFSLRSTESRATEDRTKTIQGRRSDLSRLEETTHNVGHVVLPSSRQVPSQCRDPQGDLRPHSTILLRFPTATIHVRYRRSCVDQPKEWNVPVRPHRKGFR